MVSNSSKTLSYKNFSGVFDPTRLQINLNPKLRESSPPNVTTLNDFDNQGKIPHDKTPLDIINEYAGPKSDITASFYDDCSFIPDPSSLNPVVKHLLILDDCFLGPQSKAESYYTRGLPLGVAVGRKPEGV